MTHMIVRQAVRTTGRWPLTLLYVAAAATTTALVGGALPPLVGVATYLILACAVLAGNARYHASRRDGRR